MNNLRLPLNSQFKIKEVAVVISATTEVSNIVKNKMRPVHPGEILREEYLVPMGRASMRWRRHCAWPPRGCMRS